MSAACRFNGAELIFEIEEAGGNLGAVCRASMG